MIETSLTTGHLFYRAHNPKWASQPLSGAGAAKTGGRFNRPGLHALYLSDSPETALAEYRQLDSLLPPCTLVTYRVTLRRVVDFHAGYDPQLWNPLWQDWACQWRRLSIYERTEPPSWVLGDQVVQAGFVALLFPSTCCRGLNLVIYVDGLSKDDAIVVHDPGATLPRNHQSWE